MARPPPRLPPHTADDVEQQFYDALRGGDIESLMAAWANDDDICCVHPDGSRLIGAAAIRAAFDAVFANGGLPVHPERVRRLQGAACAVHSVVERLRVTMSEGPRDAWVVATNVYLLGADGWRMVAHHASPGSAHDLEADPEVAAVLH